MANVAAFIAALIAQIKFGGSNQSVIRLASLSINQDDPSSNIEATTGLVFAVTGVVGATGIILVLETIFKSKHNSTSKRIFTLLVSDPIVNYS